METNNETTETVEQETNVEPENERRAHNSEAAKYRHQLREVEQERDSIKQQLEKARLAIVKTAAVNAEIEPNVKLISDAFSDADLPLDELFTDGELDTDKLMASLTTVHQDRPYLFNRDLSRGNVAPTEGSTVNTGNKNNWSKAFAPVE